MRPEDIKIVKEQPPFLLQIVAAGMTPEPTTIYPYGSIIYNPSGLAIPPDILVHELKHIAQQGNNPKDWWEKYIIYKDFRFNQELEANQEQYKFVCKVLKDRNDQARALLAIARNMAGEVYDLNADLYKIMEKIKCQN